MQLLIDKYKPKNISQFVGNIKARKEIEEWIKKKIRGEAIGPLFIHGEPGTGKTAIAEAIANDLGWDLVRIDAVDIRTKEQIDRFLNGIGMRSFSGAQKMLLIDDIDGIKLDKGRAKGVISDIAKKIKDVRAPIVITGSDAWDKNVAPIRAISYVVKFNRPTKRQVIPYLAEIGKREGIGYNDVLKVVDETNGDIRAALNSMQAMVFSVRDQKMNIFEVLRKYFYAKSIKEARDALFDVDFNTIDYWIEEVVANSYRDKKEALDYLALSSLFGSRTRKSWKMLKYKIDMLCSLPLFRDNVVRISYPSWLRKRSDKIKQRKELAKRLAEVSHSSQRKAAQEIDILFAKS